MIDLGAWAAETYRVPAVDADVEDIERALDDDQRKGSAPSTRSEE